MIMKDKKERKRIGIPMEEAAKRYLERGGEKASGVVIDSLPRKFFEPLVTHGLQVDLVEPGRLVCSFTVPTRLLVNLNLKNQNQSLPFSFWIQLMGFFCFCVWKNAGNFLHGGATATLVDLVGSAVLYTVGAPMVGVSVEINVSYLDAAYAGVSPNSQMSYF